MTDLTFRPADDDLTVTVSVAQRPPADDDTSTGPAPADDHGGAETAESSGTAVPDDAPDDDELDDAFPVSELPAVPRAGAVAKLVDALVQQTGMPEGAARAVARACVRPDEVRRRLAFPVPERVPGGTIHSITVPVFSSALATYPVNLREAVDRQYAFAGVGHDDDAGYPSLSQVTSEHGETAELAVGAQSREHVIASLKRSQAFLRSNNAYDDSIAKNGVLKEVYAVAIRIDHGDGSPAAYTLGTADGSSRAGSCHRLTGATPEQIVYGWPADDRAWRNDLGRDLALTKQPYDGLAADEQRKVRALVIPCKIAIRYEPDPGSELTYAQAVRFVVGLTHVDPPKPWDRASELDALAEAAIDELLRQQRISDEDARYLGGDMAPQEAGARGYGDRPDQRAAFVYRTLLSPRNLPVTKRGIRRVTAKPSVKYYAAVDVAVELALRAWRPTLTRAQASRADAVRSASQRAMRLTEVRDHAWALTSRSPERLRDAALSELGDGVAAGPAAVELAVLAGWHLLTGEHMKRELTSSSDRRALDKVLRALMTTGHGVQQLAQALADGRDGQPARKVDEEGSASSQDEPVDDDWVRRTWAESDEPVDLELDDSRVDTPETLLRTAQDRVDELTTRLVTAVDAVTLVRGARRALVLEQGWASGEVESLTARLDGAARALRKWAAIHDASNVVRDAHEQDADEQDDGQP